MLKRQKLYRDTNNTIYHVLTDGSIRTYPDFKIITTVDESKLFPERARWMFVIPCIVIRLTIED